MMELVTIELVSMALLGLLYAIVGFFVIRSARQQKKLARKMEDQCLVHRETDRKLDTIITGQPQDAPSAGLIRRWKQQYNDLPDGPKREAYGNKLRQHGLLED